MAKKQRRTPLSRKKYEEANPVVSFRVPEELHDRLRVAKEKEGISYTDARKAGLGIFEVKIRAEEEIRQQVYDEQWEKGVTQARELYVVTYPCSVCGKEIEVTTDEEKVIIRTYISQ